MPYYQQTVLFPLPKQGRSNHIEMRNRSGTVRNNRHGNRDRDVNSILSYLK